MKYVKTFENFSINERSGADASTCLYIYDINIDNKGIRPSLTSYNYERGFDDNILNFYKEKLSQKMSRDHEKREILNAVKYEQLVNAHSGVPLLIRLIDRNDVTVFGLKSRFVNRIENEFMINGWFTPFWDGQSFLTDNPKAAGIIDEGELQQLCDKNLIDVLELTAALKHFGVGTSLSAASPMFSIQRLTNKLDKQD